MAAARPGPGLADRVPVGAGAHGPPHGEQLEHMGIRKGDTVLVNKKYRAYVRFIGRTSFKDGIWFGVELEKEKGKHDGTVRADLPRNVATSGVGA